MTVRDIMPGDIGACLEIYNHYIENTVFTLELEPLGFEDFSARVGEISRRFPYLVCEAEGVIAGYAYLSLFRPRAGYRFTRDLAIYVRHDLRHTGAGRLLMEELISRASADSDVRDIIATITTENTVSIAFHEKMGFRMAGRLEGVAEKFGKRLGVVFMQKTLK